MRLRFAPFVLASVPVAFAVIGCGGSNYSPSPSNSTFSVSPSTATITTGGQVQFSATLNSGGNASVNWAILSGQNDSNIGQGTIDPTGLYTPPAAITQGNVQVKIQANLTSSLLTTATSVINVTPGFNQPVTPETAAIGSGGSVPLNAVITQVNGGSVNWSLSASPNSVTTPASGSGAISNASCNHSSSALTSCTATYTAPSGTTPAGPLFAIAAVASNPQTIASAKLLLNNAGINSSPLNNQATQNSPIEMGTSGGDNNDFDTDANGNILDCSSGTLGALVKDASNTQYILSNNHVLAESDQATIGDTMIQPGLVDTGCTPLQAGISGINAVGTLKYVVPLNSNATNVDAALAAAASNVDATGAILSLGTAASGNNGQLSSAPPAGGTGEVLTAANLNTLQVAKSGRTTGLTCSTVDSIADTFQVDYYKDAAGTIFYTTKTFTDQIGVPGRYFTDFGDSGSLVLDTANAQPIGLFFAGAISADGLSGESFANPISDVLTELSQQSAANGSLQLQVVGGPQHAITCLNYDANTAVPASSSATLAPAEHQKALEVARGEGQSLVNPSAGILGVAAGRSLDRPGQAAVIVYVDRAKPTPSIPQLVAGLRTQIIATTPSELASNTAPAVQVARAGIHLSESMLREAIAVHDRVTPEIMQDPAFFGVGVTESFDNPAEAALLVMVDPAKTPSGEPATIGGLRVRYLELRRIRITVGHQSTGANATDHELAGPKVPASSFEAARP